jgi:hypothetical protein
MSWYTRTDEDGAVWLSFDTEYWFRVYKWDKRPTGALASNATSSPPRSALREDGPEVRPIKGRDD